MDDDFEFTDRLTTRDRVIAVIFFVGMLALVAGAVYLTA